MKIQTRSMVLFKPPASRLWQRYAQLATDHRNLRGQYAPEYPNGQVSACFSARKFNAVFKNYQLTSVVPG